MPHPNTIPRQTAQATLQWGLNFVTVIELNPATYFVDAPTVVSLRTLVDDFEATWNVAGVVAGVAVNPSGYTQPNRALLGTARMDFLGLASQVAFEIHGNSAISDADKLLAGVVPRNFVRNVIPPPSTFPIIDLQVASSGIHQLVYADSLTPGLRAKPEGVETAQLFQDITVIGTPGVLANARIIQTVTKTPIVIALDAGDNGMLASYWLRWLNGKGEPGPFSASISAVVMF